MGRLRERFRNWDGFVKLDLSAWMSGKDALNLSGEEREAHLSALGEQKNNCLEFLRERIPAPSPKEFYKAEDYWGSTNPLLDSIWDTMLKLAWINLLVDILKGVLSLLIVASLLWGQAHIWGGVLLAVIALDFAFLHRIRQTVSNNPYELFKEKLETARHFLPELKYDDSWAKARYALDFWDVGIGPEGRDANVRGDEEYEWREVPSDNAGQKNYKPEYMIVNKATGEEAPLNPALT